MPSFTQRQNVAWIEVLAELKARGIDAPEGLYWPWIVHWEDEVRPGRGHAFQGIYADSDSIATVTMDVYGHPLICIGEVTWIHNSEDEECGCGCQSDGGDA